MCTNSLWAELTVLLSFVFANQRSHIAVTVCSFLHGLKMESCFLSEWMKGETAQDWGHYRGSFQQALLYGWPGWAILVRIALRCSAGLRGRKERKERRVQLYQALLFFFVCSLFNKQANKRTWGTRQCRAPPIKLLMKVLSSCNTVSVIVSALSTERLWKALISEL